MSGNYWQGTNSSRRYISSSNRCLSVSVYKSRHSNNLIECLHLLQSGYLSHLTLFGPTPQPWSFISIFRDLGVFLETFEFFRRSTEQTGTNHQCWIVIIVLTSVFQAGMS